MPSIRKCVEGFVNLGWDSIFMYPSRFKERPFVKNGTLLYPIYFPFRLYPEYFPSKRNSLRYRRKVPFLHTLPIMFASILYFIVFSMVAWSASQRLKPHLLYAHQNIAIIVASVLKQFLHVPLVARIYGFWLPSVLIGEEFSLQKLALSIPARIALKSRADLFVITDDGTRGKDVCQRFQLAKDRYLVLRNGVDVPSEVLMVKRPEARKLLGLSRERPIAVFVGFMERFKRIDRIVRVAEVAKKNKCVWSFLLIGQGHDRSLQEDIVRMKGLGDYVFFKGPIPHSDVFLYMRAADVFLALHDLSSLSNTLLESLAVGTPVICSHKGKGIESLVVPNLSGCMVENPDDPYEVLACLQKVLETEFSEERIRAEVRIYSWQERLHHEFKHIQRLIEAYDKACSPG